MFDLFRHCGATCAHYILLCVVGNTSIVASPTRLDVCIHTSCRPDGSYTLMQDAVATAGHDAGASQHHANCTSAQADLASLPVAVMQQALDAAPRAGKKNTRTGSLGHGRRIARQEGINAGQPQLSTHCTGAMTLPPKSSQPRSSANSIEPCLQLQGQATASYHSHQTQTVAVRPTFQQQTQHMQRLNGRRQQAHSQRLPGQQLQELQLHRQQLQGQLMHSQQLQWQLPYSQEMQGHLMRSQQLQRQQMNCHPVPFIHRSTRAGLHAETPLPMMQQQGHDNRGTAQIPPALLPLVQLALVQHLGMRACPMQQWRRPSVQQMQPSSAAAAAMQHMQHGRM